MKDGKIEIFQFVKRQRYISIIIRRREKLVCLHETEATWRNGEVIHWL